MYIHVYCRLIGKNLYLVHVVMYLINDLCPFLKGSKFLENPWALADWLQNHPQFLLHFLIHIDVLMLCRKFELIPTKSF